jgi:hypothetical protein
MPIAVTRACRIQSHSSHRQFHIIKPASINVQLTINEGTASETTVCKQVVVSGCVDSLIISNDTTICAGSPFQILTHPAISYQWTPSAFLDNPNAAMPVTTTTQNIKYYVDAMLAGDNLVRNGDFSNGNTDFQSGYTYTPTNVTEGEYFVQKIPKHGTSLSITAVTILTATVKCF